MRTNIFYSPVRRGYIRKVSVHLVQNYFPHDFSTDSISCSEQKIKEYDKNNFKTRQAQGIYDNDGGVGGGRWAQEIQQQQQRRLGRIDITSKGSETTTEAATAWRRARWIGNGNRVSILLAIASLPVTLSRLCLVAVLFWYCFHHTTFPRSLQERLSVLQSCGKYFYTKCTLTLRMQLLRTVE